MLTARFRTVNHDANWKSMGPDPSSLSASNQSHPHSPCHLTSLGAPETLTAKSKVLGFKNLAKTPDMLFKMGDVEVWRILEIHVPFLTTEELFPTAGPDVRAVVEAHVPGGVCTQSGRLVLPIQGFLLKTPRPTPDPAFVIFDTTALNMGRENGWARVQFAIPGWILATIWH